MIGWGYNGKGGRGCHDTGAQGQAAVGIATAGPRVLVLSSPPPHRAQRKALMKGARYRPLPAPVPRTQGWARRTPQAWDAPSSLLQPPLAVAGHRSPTGGVSVQSGQDKVEEGPSRAGPVRRGCPLPGQALFLCLSSSVPPGRTPH